MEMARGSSVFRKILDSLPVCVAYVDGDARYQFINGTYSEWFGLTEDLFLGRTVQEVHGPERWGRMAAAVRGALAGEPQRFELQVQPNNGQAFELIVQYVPNISERGTPEGYFVLSEDITTEREAARTVEWNETLLREALSSASMMAWEWDQVARRTTRTSNAMQVLGFVPEITQTPIAQFIHPDDFVLTRDVLIDAVQRMAPYVVQFRFQRPDNGQWRWLETRATPRRSDDGRLVVQGLICDVTERHELEIESRANEERLRLAQGVGRLGTWTWDLASGEVSWSREMEALHGLEAGAFGGTFEEFIERVHPEDREKTLASVDTLQQTGSHEIEHRIVLPDDTVRWIYGRGQLFHDAAGNPTYALGVALDITERRVAAEVQERLVEELQAANSAKDELLGLVSHELRTPLTTLGGTASVLRRHWQTIDLPARQTALLDIELGAKRLEQIVENMLTLAHSETMHPEILEPVLLRRVIAAELAEQEARFPNRETTFRTPDELLPVLGNEGYIRQVLGNLLSNAAKYGGDSPIEVTLEKIGGEATVTVADRGKGIPEGEVGRVFEAFFRSPLAPKHVSGIGLGLTVCKRLVELQNGRIWCEAREGGGAAFKFAFPIVEP